jgi:upstream activation factor subunit UAF30
MPTAKKATTPVETQAKGAKKAPVAAKSVPVIKAAEVVKPVPVTEKPDEPVKAADTATTATTATTPQENVLQTIIEKVNSFVAMGKEIQGQLKVLSKEWDKQQKIIDKVQKKRQNAKNSPSGFAKPNKISDELCDFIGEPHGTEKSRTDITRFINAYIKEHKLNKPENKRFILPDDKLRKILNVNESEEINYFILQKLISHHFPPSASKQAAAAAAAAAK